MLFHKKRPAIRYDAEKQIPAVRKSICTGEMTAGFIDRESGRFQELMKIESLERFREETGAEEIRIIY